MRSRIVAFIVVVVFCVPVFLLPNVQADSSPVDYHTPQLLRFSSKPNLTAQIYTQYYLYWKYVEAAAANIDAEKARQAEIARKVALANNTIPPAWVATAMCEEHMRNDSNYGYFGIKSWMGFGGYAKAGDAPLSVQLGWEAKYQGSPPDAPGQCHSY